MIDRRLLEGRKVGVSHYVGGGGIGDDAVGMRRKVHYYSIFHKNSDEKYEILNVILIFSNLNPLLIVIYFLWLL